MGLISMVNIKILIMNMILMGLIKMVFIKVLIININGRHKNTKDKYDPNGFDMDGRHKNATQKNMISMALI